MFLPKSKLWHPEIFLGKSRSKKYFEGWYFKLVALNGKTLAVILGLAIDKSGKKEIFIQTLNGTDLSSRYFVFQEPQAEFSSFSFSVKIGNNSFGVQELVLDLPEIKGRLSFHNNNFWPRKFFNPGIMGPFAFLPFLECRHDVINLSGTIEGRLTIERELIDFSGGKVYLEKDWGHSFPVSYLWLQSNSFSQAGASLMLSVARVPFLGLCFNGLIAFLLLENKLYKFSTYNFSKIKNLNFYPDRLEITLQSQKYILKIQTDRPAAGKLSSPRGGLMSGQIEESLNAVCEVELIDRRSEKIIFKSRGNNTALEILGKVG